MKSIVLKANAKINLSLNITGKLDNNYHELDSVVSAIDFCDEITITPSDIISIDCSDKKLANKSNIAYKAAKLILEFAAYDKGCSIYIQKNIWMQAGMGGGSSDAAAVLIGLNILFSLDISNSDMIDLALILGADVPLFLGQGLARIKGIGEKVTYYEVEDELNIILIQDNKGLSTKEVFDFYDRNVCNYLADNDELIVGIKNNDLDKIKNNMHNCLQSTAKILDDSIGRSIDLIKTMGATSAMMTGSGSAIFGVIKNRDIAQRIFRYIKQEYNNAYLTTTTSSFIKYKFM